MRSPRRLEDGLRRGAWSPQEDQLLIEYIRRYRIWNWTLMPKFAGLSRSGKSCRLRWVNYLNPELNHGSITKEEEDTIIRMYSELGSRWSVIAARLPGRTDNQIKNYWHTHLKKHFEEKKVQPRIKTNKTEGTDQEHKYEANTLNSNESLTLECSNLPMTPNMSVGESSSSSACSTVEDVGGKSSYLNRDQQSFWPEPFSYENMLIFKEEEVQTHEEWYQEPLSPYSLYNNEHWYHHLLLGGDGDGSEAAV